MIFSTIEWDLGTLIKNYEDNLLNLNPPYQRGDIWSSTNKKRLIESIKLKYPLPIFFVYKKDGGIYDMVDGQQRTRTIIGYTKGFFSDLEKVSFADSDQQFFLKEYKISVCVITVAEEGEIEDFYFRVNKFGTKLNRPEILKAQFGNTLLQTLVQYIADTPQFKSLEMFSSSTLNRLSDIDFIGELLTLLNYGITDKKLSVDKFYEDKSFDFDKSKELERIFFNILDDILRFNDVFQLSNTRYKQRNDMYTLFNFLMETRGIHKSTLDYFYKLLVVIGPDISPSQDDCYAFQQYAINCVSQSNSKNAREERLLFFKEFLLNQKDVINFDDDSESTIKDVIQFYGLTSKDMILVENYYVIDLQKLMLKTDRLYFA